MGGPQAFDCAYVRSQGDFKDVCARLQMPQGCFFDERASTCALSALPTRAFRSRSQSPPPSPPLFLAGASSHLPSLHRRLRRAGFANIQTKESLSEHRRTNDPSGSVRETLAELTHNEMAVVEAHVCLHAAAFASPALSSFGFLVRERRAAAGRPSFLFRARGCGYACDVCDADSDADRDHCDIDNDPGKDSGKQDNCHCDCANGHGNHLDKDNHHNHKRQQADAKEADGDQVDTCQAGGNPACDETPTLLCSTDHTLWLDDCFSAGSTFRDCWRRAVGCVCDRSHV